MGFEFQDLRAWAQAPRTAIDQEFEKRMDAMLDHARVGPHGQPIPAKNATWPKLGLPSPLDLPPRTSGRISRITTGSTETVKRLHGIGVHPDAVAALDGIASPCVGGARASCGRSSSPRKTRTSTVR